MLRIIDTRSLTAVSVWYPLVWYNFFSGPLCVTHAYSRTRAHTNLCSEIYYLGILSILHLTIALNLFLSLKKEGGGELDYICNSNSYYI